MAVTNLWRYSVLFSPFFFFFFTDCVNVLPVALGEKKKMQEIPVMPFSAASQIIHNNQHGTSCLLWLHAKSPEILVPHCVVTHSDQGYELLASLSASGEFELSVAPCHFFVASRFDLNNQNSHKCVSKGFTICKVYKPLCPQIQIQNS